MRRIVSKVVLSSAIAGAFLSATLPEDWFNLTASPSFLAWFVTPAIFVYVALGMALGVDVMTDAADPSVAFSLQILASAFVPAIYTLLVLALVKAFKRLRMSLRNPQA